MLLKYTNVSGCLRAYTVRTSQQLFRRQLTLCEGRAYFSQTVNHTISNQKGKPGWRGPLAIALGFGLALGGGYGMYEKYAVPDRNNRILIPVSADDSDGIEKKKIVHPSWNVKTSRVVDGPTDFLGLEFKLFQYQSCPFCCKVRAFLEFFGIPFSIVEVNSVFRSELKFSKYKKVPILVVKDSAGEYHQLNDSTAIISILASYLLKPEEGLNKVLSNYQNITYKDETSGKDVTEVVNRYFLLFNDEQLSQERYDQLSEERKWREWVDKHMVHVISPNIYRSRSEARETFEQFSINGHWEDIFSWFERSIIINAGSVVMYFIGKRLKKKYHLKEDVRESLYDTANKWMKAVGDRQFMGGNQPNLADLAVFGVLNSFEGCQAFEDLTQNTTIGPWFVAVKESVRLHVASHTVPRLTKKIST